MKSILIALTLFSVSPAYAATTNPDLPDLSGFINEMVQKHHFNADYLSQNFDKVKVQESILKAISRPAEKSKPWYEYRKIFITEKRINAGVKFWQDHKEALDQAEKKYGVPAKIIVAIIGVETRYGGNVGSYRVLDALSTLAFRYPPRAKFFRSELEQFLLLTREEKMSPLTPVGSYAGAMGLGQFMPSSYREYAVDFDHDGKRNIWTDPADAIGSIANYLKSHGWVAGQSIVHKATVKGSVPASLMNGDLKPSLTRKQLAAVGITSESLPAGDDPLALIALAQPNGNEYWLARQNFYVITRYNHSAMYAMAVTQLGRAIRKQVEK